MSNRKIVKEQFADGTTIDGSAIDKALDELVDYHNEVPAGFIDGRWMPVNYVSHWSPARSYWRSQTEPSNTDPYDNRSRQGPQVNTNVHEHYFPFLAVRNWEDEHYPVSIANLTPQTYDNEYRHKGFSQNVSALGSESFTRATTNGKQEFTDPADPAAGDIDDANGIYSYNNWETGATVDMISHPQNNKMLAVTFSYYFKKPVILSALNVVANQEHPISYYASGYSTAGAPLSAHFQMNTAQPRSYKSNIFGTIPWDNPTLRCKDTNKFIEDMNDLETNLAETGAEFSGAQLYGVGGSKTDPNSGINISTQVSIDNEFNKEQRELNNMAVQIRNIDTKCMFNRMHTTNNRDGAYDYTGGQYTDMEPAYPGGSTWGIWITEKNLNIPIPRDSRVRFTVLVRGLMASQAFEWNCNLTVLEEVED